MSRIGMLPIEVPNGVEVNITATAVSVNGPKGKLSYKILPVVTVAQEGNIIKVTRDSDSKEAKSAHGLVRSLIYNMVKGVTDGFEKTLEFTGVGFRAKVEGDTLVLNMGYSHPIEIKAPEGISFRTAENKITVLGHNKEQVGLIAAKVRSVRLPEPYKGKGIRYIDEVIRRKAGKAGKAAGGTK